MTALRIWSGEESSPVIDDGNDLPERARVTVREYYERELEQSRTRLKPGTLALDRNAIGRWERFGGAWAKRWSLNRFHKFEYTFSVDQYGERLWLSSPPIGSVADVDLELFVHGLEQHGYSPSSVDQTCRVLSMIFAHAGPRERGNRGQDVLIRRPVFPARNTAPFEMKRFLSRQEVSDLYLGAGTVDRISQRIPRRSIPDLGRALVVFGSNYGLRPDDLTRLEWGRNLSPDASELKFVANKTKRKKPFEVRYPINDVTREHLLRIRQPSRPEVFFRRNQYRQLQKLWRRIVDASGVPKTVRQDVDGREYMEPSLYSLRRYCGDTLNAHCSHNSSGSWVLGHAIEGVKQVTARHYTNAGQCPEYVRDALFSVAQPDAFLQSSWPSTPS